MRCLPPPPCPRVTHDLGEEEDDVIDFRCQIAYDSISRTRENNAGASSGLCEERGERGGQVVEATERVAAALANIPVVGGASGSHIEISQVGWAVLILSTR